MILLVLSLLFVPYPTQAEQKLIRVGIVDTGLDLADRRFFSVLCKNGHRNFVNDTNDTYDYHGHGTHVAGTIKNHSGKGNFCLVILKYYDKDTNLMSNVYNFRRAIQHAIDLKLDIVNISAGGPQFDETEYLLLKRANKIRFITAAGNDNQNLDMPYNKFYPASYGLPNIIVVGALEESGFKLSTSNYGEIVKHWEIGQNIHAELPNEKFGYLSGTSMATAVKTGKIIKLMLNRKSQ
jgi:subtilisin family serine protease